MDINTLFDEFQKLSPVVQNMFFNLIYPLVKNSSDRVNDYIETIRETRFSKDTFCPHHRSRQRYKCKDCGKTFNNVSCSPMAGTHYPKKWAKYFQFISEGTTLPKIAKALNISISTAFYWRHKVLNSLRSMDIEQLSGIIESIYHFQK